MNPLFPFDKAPPGQRIKPLSPKKVLADAGDEIPDFVIDAFNSLLKANFRGTRCVIYQDDAIDKIIELANGEAQDGIVNAIRVDRYTIFKNKWLDIEPVFTKAGWKVEYEKASYGDSGSSYFTFSHG